MCVCLCVRLCVRVCVSPVMEVPSDGPLTEEQARLYFRDIILGMEYRKYLGAEHESSICLFNSH